MSADLFIDLLNDSTLSMHLLPGCDVVSCWLLGLTSARFRILSDNELHRRWKRMYRDGDRAGVDFDPSVGDPREFTWRTRKMIPYLPCPVVISTGMMITVPPKLSYRPQEQFVLELWSEHLTLALAQCLGPKQLHSMSKQDRDWSMLAHRLTSLPVDEALALDQWLTLRELGFLVGYTSARAVDAGPREFVPKEQDADAYVRAGSVPWLMAHDDAVAQLDKAAPLWLLGLAIYSGKVEMLTFIATFFDMDKFVNDVSRVEWMAIAACIPDHPLLMPVISLMSTSGGCVGSFSAFMTAVRSIAQRKNNAKVPWPVVMPYLSLPPDPTEACGLLWEVIITTEDMILADYMTTHKLWTRECVDGTIARHLRAMVDDSNRGIIRPTCNPCAGDECTECQPQRLARYLRSIGFSHVHLQPRDLADDGGLRRANMGVRPEGLIPMDAWIRRALGRGADGQPLPPRPIPGRGLPRVIIQDEQAPAALIDPHDPHRVILGVRHERPVDPAPPHNREEFVRAHPDMARFIRGRPGRGVHVDVEDDGDAIHPDLALFLGGQPMHNHEEDNHMDVDD